MTRSTLKTYLEEQARIIEIEIREERKEFNGPAILEWIRDNAEDFRTEWEAAHGERALG